MYTVSYRNASGIHTLDVSNEADLVAIVVTLELSVTVFKYKVELQTKISPLTTAMLGEARGLGSTPLSKNDVRTSSWKGDCEYMIFHTSDFIKRVFNEEPVYQRSYEGMVSAHGDKVTQYMDYWAEKGIDPFKAQIIYFLTYTKLMDMPKHMSKEWVVENYATYQNLLP